MLLNIVVRKNFKSMCKPDKGNHAFGDFSKLATKLNLGTSIIIIAVYFLEICCNLLWIIKFMKVLIK